ncbi:MAG: UTP--glucose-1-phosphate uridylyltransferase, partial [archaeon]|nr:UTP--glucose-1-phosphate uridylyltransferase [archaeon]
MNSNEILSMLKELNQDEILSKYNSASTEEKTEFEAQINLFEKTYPGGLREYIKRAKELLDNSLKGKSPYEGYKPSVPEGVNITLGNEEYYELERIGMEELKDTCFVLVAGGLGERLGYSDIKIGIETDLVTKRKFFEIYSSYILAYEIRLRKKYDLKEDWFIPLCIMTSGDTHEKTLKLLKDFNNFGLKEKQIFIVKQEKCPALLDNECHIALKEGKLLMETKPHGHGDVHTLLYQEKVIEKWLALGKKWMIFFQDTNVLIFNAVPSAIGTSKKLGLVMNSICTKRRPGDAVGGICKLIKDNGESLTINVEYNQLDPLLRASYNPQGDVANKEGFSDFPGNINVLAFELETYNKVLSTSKGLIPEFVNPKYTDETKTKFKAPTRLECMMQDFPKLCLKGEKIGFCNYDKLFCFSTVKNKISDGCDKLKKGINPETAFSCEQDIFKSNLFLLKDILGVCSVDETEPQYEVEVNGCKIPFTPKILIYPYFAATLGELKEKIKGKITIGNRSTLILKEDVSIEKDLKVDGIFTVDKNITEETKCENKKRHCYITLKEGEGENYEKIRGYTVKEE